MKISIVIPVYNPNLDYFKRMMKSLSEQTDKDFEVCISDSSTDKDIIKGAIDGFKNLDIKYSYSKRKLGISDNTNRAIKLSSGKYVLFLDQDDILSHEAINKLNKLADYDFIYSDMDMIDDNGNHLNYFYKPDFSLDLLYAQNYISHLSMINRSILDKIGLLDSKYDGAQDYDLILRMTEVTKNIYHIPEILYSWRIHNDSTSINPLSKPKANEAGLNALNAHLKRMYNGVATSQYTEYPYVYNTSFNKLKNKKVSIIIPMKDKYKLTEQCVYSILTNTDYKNYDIMILDNNSVEDNTKNWFDNIVKIDSRIKVIPAKFEFNWSKLQNFGIKNSDADVFIFLNNDTVITHSNWLTVLCSNALRDDVGVVGPLLCYEDNTIQHAGVVVGLNGYADHIYKGYNQVNKGINYVSPMVNRNVLAVTGACMAISRSTIKKIGYFNEKFVICGSDVEICLRAYRNGLRNIYTPMTKMYHLESKSRDSYIPPIDFKMSEKYYKEFWINGDPYFNKNLSLRSVIPGVKDMTEIDEENSRINDLRKNKRTMKKMLSNVKRKVKTVLKKNKTIVKIYRKIRSPKIYGKKLGDYPLYEITPLMARRVEIKEKIRINIMVPTLYKENVFGGIATALKFFDSFTDKNIAKRLIITETPVRSEDLDKYPDYEIVDMSSSSNSKYQAASISNRLDRTLEVCKGDIFIATAWWTAYTIAPVLKWQASEYGIKEKQLIYFIQDYEPLFYPWSSKYCYAESTYHLDNSVIAVFNSKELKDYFEINNYKFDKSFYFGPVLSDSLKSKLKELPSVPRKKKIIVYGRPMVARNAFEIIVDSLILAFKDRNDIDDWEFISVGEEHPDVPLINGTKLHSLGKLTLDNYANLMNDAYLGISLMVSPHPSYPPLEMSTFGVKTITNNYANKDMSYFNDNIISVNECTPEYISSEIKKLCDNFNENGEKSMNEDYINSGNQFDKIAKDIIKIIK